MTMLSDSVINSSRPTVRSGKGGGAAFSGILHISGRLSDGTAACRPPSSKEKAKENAAIPGTVTTGRCHVAIP